MGNTRYNLSNNFKQMEYKLMYVANSIYDKDWHSIQHYHNFSEIFFIISGVGSMKVGKQEINVKENDLVIINPNVFHTEKSQKDNPLNYIVLGVDRLRFDDHISSAQEKKDYNLVDMSEHKEGLLYYLKLLLEEVEKKEHFYELACNNIFTLFLLYIIRYTNSNIKVAMQEKKISTECLSIKKYIDANYSLNIDLDILSKMTSLNKYHLAHSFKKYVGDSPINYLISKRISASKDLLKSTNHTIYEISDIVGFSSTSYFSQQFKRKVGMSPIKFRNQKEI